MQYSRLGETGLLVSRLAFGAMTFGKAEGPMAAITKVDQKLANDLVGHALDNGVNFFNTADAYAGGQSESMLAEALGSRRSDVVIATKVGFRSGDALLQQGLSRQHILSSAEGSLRRLRTDYIDVYLVHRLDPITPVEETLEALQQLVSQGKVRYIGFSNWPAWLAAKAVGIQKQLGWSRFRAAEMYYSLVGRDLEHEIVPFVQDAGIGVMIWSPLVSGFLSGKYTRQNPGGDGGRLTGFDFIPFDRERGYDVVDRLKQTGERSGASPAQVALAWLLTKPFVASILIGATKMRQLQDNLGACDIALDPADIRGLDEFTEPAPIYPNWFNRNTGDEKVRKALGEGPLPAVAAR